MAVDLDGNNRRNAAKELAWREIMAKQAKSCIPVARFCRERGITASVFYYWKQELVRRDAERNAGSQSLGPQPAKPAADFAEVAVTNPEYVHDPIQRNAAPITIRIAGDYCLELSRDFDPQTLRQVLRVLRGESC